MKTNCTALLIITGVTFIIMNCLRTDYITHAQFSTTYLSFSFASSLNKTPAGFETVSPGTTNNESKTALPETVMPDTNSNESKTALLETVTPKPSPTTIATAPPTSSHTQIPTETPTLKEMEKEGIDYSVYLSVIIFLLSGILGVFTGHFVIYRIR